MVEELDIQKTKIAKKISRIEGELRTQAEVGKALPKVIMDQIEPKLQAIDLFPDQLEEIAEEVDKKFEVIKTSDYDSQQALNKAIASLEERLDKESSK